MIQFISGFSQERGEGGIERGGDESFAHLRIPTQKPEKFLITGRDATNKTSRLPQYTYTYRVTMQTLPTTETIVTKTCNTIVKLVCNASFVFCVSEALQTLSV